MRWTIKLGAILLSACAVAASTFAAEPGGCGAKSCTPVHAKKHCFWDCFRPEAPIDAEVIESVAVRRITPETVRAEMVVATQSLRLTPTPQANTMTLEQAAAIVKHLQRPETAKGPPVTPETVGEKKCCSPAPKKPGGADGAGLSPPLPTPPPAVPESYPTTQPRNQYVSNQTPLAPVAEEDEAPRPPVEDNAAIEERMNRLESKFDRLVEILEKL